MRKNKVVDETIQIMIDCDEWTAEGLIEELEEALKRCPAAYQKAVLKRVKAISVDNEELAA